MDVMAYGPDAVLAEPDDPRDVASLRAALAGLPGVIEAVAGARTVLVSFAADAEQLVRAALAAPVTGPATGPGDTGPVVKVPVVEVPVDYDGDDLAEVARETGLTHDEVVRRHAGAAYTVRFCGFAPGFAYLDGLDPALHVPRRAEPRARVPAGSVAIAGEFAGVYPRSSPGGWRLVGHTDLVLWDLTAAPPALLVPGTRVRFVPA